MHGYGACKETFNYQLNYFAQFFKVYAPDLPGFKSPLKSPLSLADYAKIVDGFILESGEKNFSVIAHSFGVRILLKLMPYNFDKIVITGGAGLKTRKSPAYYFKKWGYRSIKATFGENSAKKFSQKFNKNGIDNMPKNNKISFIKIVNEPLDDKLSKVLSPTLIIYGNKDKETPLYLAKKFNRGIKDSALIILRGGHFVFIDDYMSFNVIVKEFLL